MELFAQTTGDTVNTPTSLADFVGEGKKYKTEEDFVKSRIEADRFIEQLKSEALGLRDELTRLSSTDQKLDELMDRLKTTNSNLAPSSAVTKTGESGDESKALSLSDIESLLDQKLTARQAEAIKQRNLESAIAEVTSVWGVDANVKMNQAARELNKSMKELEDLAKTDPLIFKRVIGLNTLTTTNQTRTVTSSIDGNRMGSSGVKNKKHFDEIRKSNKALYFTPAIQNEMFKSAKELGDQFYE